MSPPPTAIRASQAGNNRAVRGLGVIAVAITAAAVALGVLAQPAPGAPTRITWVDLGRHGERTTGTFTASGLLCPSGTFTDTGGAAVGRLRVVHSCDDGSGTFTLTETPPAGWTFGSDGTGRYASLRGRGTCRVSTSEDGSTFMRSCEAIADFDDVAPSATIERFTTARSGKAYILRVGFRARDNVESNAVSFKLAIVASGRRIAAKAGQVAGGTTAYALKLRPPKRAGTLTIVLELADPVGNAAQVRRSTKLRR